MRSYLYDTAAGVALCAVAFAVGCAPGDDVRCMNVDETSSALGRLMEQDWRDWSLDDFRPFYAFGREEEIRDEDYEEGLAGIEQAIADCCETCAICSWPAMDLESNYNYGMEVRMCPTDLAAVETAYDRFLGAVSLPDGSLWWQRDPGVSPPRSAHRWTGPVGDVLLQLQSFELEDQYGMRVVLGRCDSFDQPVERRTFATGGSLPVLRWEREENELSIDYQSDCYLLSNRKCVEDEVLVVWPAIRDEANRTGADVVRFHPENCSGGTGLTFRKNTEGEWTS